MSKTTVPKYSFEILVVIGVLVLANIVFLILGEYRLRTYSYTLFIVITTIQLLRLMRARHQMDREYVQMLREEIERHKVARAES